MSETFRGFHFVLVLACKPFVYPQELLAFVHHADEAAVAWILGFEQGVEFAQSCTIATEGNAVFECVSYPGHSDSIFS
jgi:hypothetical protein